MSLFRVEKRTDYPTGSLQELFRRRQGPYSTAGVPVDPDSARRLSAVWACIDLIAGLVSTLPVDECRERRNGGKEEVERGALFNSPDGELGLTGWIYQAVESAVSRGNTYGLILTRDREGWPSKIQLLDPGVVQVEQAGRPLGRWRFKLEGEPIRRFDPLSGEGDLWHVPAYLRAGSPIGLSVLSYAAMSIGTGLAATEFGGNWFRDSATPAAVISNEKQSNKTTADLMKTRWMQALLGNREPVVLADGWKYQPIQVSAEESQFLATIRASVSDVARFFRVPPSEIGAVLEGDSDTYSNQEQRNLALLTYTLQPWLVRFEEALTGLRPRGRYVKFNVDAFLRVDLKTRYAAHDLAIRDGWKSVDEVRALEDMAPLPGDEGKKYLWPPLRQQLTEEELGTGEPIEGGVDDSPDEGGANNGSGPEGASIGRRRALRPSADLHS